jgi:hypothetical protein
VAARAAEQGPGQARGSTRSSTPRIVFSSGARYRPAIGSHGARSGPGPPGWPAGSIAMNRSFLAAVNAHSDRNQAGQRVDPPPRRARVKQRLQLLPRLRGQLLAATGTGFDHARTRARQCQCGHATPMRACHAPFMQTSETYMIGWRARVYQQCDFVLLVACHTKRGNSGTRRSPERGMLARKS